MASTPTSIGLGYLPGLDGLRAVAVSAVFLFHAGLVTRGILGVDVLFVISGFLIAALAVGEIVRTWSQSLAMIWGRRASGRVGRRMRRRLCARGQCRRRTPTDRFPWD